MEFPPSLAIFLPLFLLRMSVKPSRN
jgi:hypothetical protein